MEGSNEVSELNTNQSPPLLNAGSKGTLCGREVTSTLSGNNLEIDKKISSAVAHSAHSTIPDTDEVVKKSLGAQSETYR